MDSRFRRGNTIVLVTGILVLLVIIATAYVTRTQAGRYTATSYVTYGLRESVQQHIAEELAREVAIALFARPVDPAPPVAFNSIGIANATVSSNWPRLAPPADAVRHSRDSVFTYNYAPYHVVPWTNWPDFTAVQIAPLDPTLWPKGHGNLPGGAPAGTPLLQAILAGEDNPFGNPGFNDARWLRDLEPLRWDSWDIFANGPGQDGIPDAFSHYRHITNISRADNGWRVCIDIADIGNAGVVTDLTIPIEQWLTVPHGYLVGASGNSAFPGTNFWPQWNNWFTLSGYQSAFTNPAQAPNGIPPNFYCLADLDGDGIRHEPGELPQDEFVGFGMADAQGTVWPFGTPRNNVSRVLTDTDGDGYTDAFWFLAPSSVNNGIRTIVAISIVDNAGMLNVNVATRFARNNTDWAATLMKTVGLTPSDLALVGMGMPWGITGSNINNGNGHWNVGAFDNPDHWSIFNPTAGLNIRFSAPTGWNRFVGEIGLQQLGGTGLTAFPDVALRLDYWRNAASNPLSANVLSRYTPFTLGDEIELRMFSGNNFPWAGTRFEFATESAESGSTLYFIRSGSGREESSEYLDQLTNREKVIDFRNRLTLYSSTRNDLMPPWLWAFDPLRQPHSNAGHNEDLNCDFTISALDVDLFEAGMRKFDLRLGVVGEVLGPFDPVNICTPASGIPEPAPYLEFIDYNADIDDYNYKFSIALRNHLRQCLMDTQVGLPPGNPGTYYGVANDGEEKVNRLDAAYAANITQWRDANWVSPIAQAVPVAPSSTNPNPTTRFLGMEAQPFIVEAFIGHVYNAQIVPQFDQDGDPYLDAGDYILLDYPAGPVLGASRRSTIVVVQIANPHNIPIDLRDYRISVFGQDLNLDSTNTSDSNRPRLRNDVTGVYSDAPYILEPATDEKPTTAIYYSIDPSLIGTDINDLKWRNFLDLEIGDHPAGTIIATTEGVPWDRDRDHYDGPVLSSANDSAIEFLRRDPNGMDWVVIDRFDPPGAGNQSFGDAVRSMGDPNNRPCEEPIPLNFPDVPPTGGAWYHDTCAPEDFRLGPAGLGYNQWVQWVRGTRAWGADVNGNGRYDPAEKNPRYVFGDRAVITPGGSPVGSLPAVDGTTLMRGGNRYKFARNADDDPASLPVANLPWFTRSYTLALPASPTGTQPNVIAPDPDVYAADPANPDYRFPRKPTFFDMNRTRDPVPACGNPGSDPNYPLGFSYPDKGWYSQGDGPDDAVSSTTIRLSFPMQMLQKDGDFEQVGELLNVWLYGHEIDMPGGVFSGVTTTTFSEFMSQDTAASAVNHIELVGDDARVNRLRVEPVTFGGDVLGAVVGIGQQTQLADPRHGVPALPAGARLLDAFVCDGYGVDPITDLNNDGVVDTTSTAVGNDLWLRNNRILGNAKNFDGTGTPGMVNINTASPEVASANPLWHRLVHETGLENPQPQGPGTCPTSLATLFNFAGQPVVTDGSSTTALLPRPMIPEAILHYREGFNGELVLGSTTPHLSPNGIRFGANYENRRERYGTATSAWMRGERGIVSIGEAAMLTRAGQAPPPGAGQPGYISRPTTGTPFDFIYNQYWRADMGITPEKSNANPAKPLWSFHPNTTPALPFQASMRVSTDRSDVYDPFAVQPPWPANTPIMRPDTTAGDIEEANALFAGASNIITTRSDTFTVYFRIRSFRQNTSVNPPIWDATNLEYIVDDSRYVMLVDRSTVNKPGDKPRILYMEKLPN